MRTFKLNSYASILIPAALVMGAGIVQASQPDDRIEATARDSYNFKTYLKNDAIKVASSEGVVTLTGTVATEYHKTLAEETVAGLPGVKSVNNQLALAGEQPAEHSDSWITLKVKTALAFHRNVSATGTEVTTQDGIVTLRGEADSEAQKQLTSEYVNDIDGVMQVRNEMTVQKPAKPAPKTMAEKVDDASITAQVKTTLLFHKSTHAMATKVTTKDGVVTLHGEAQNAAEKDLVGKLTEDIKGVRHVNNKMYVPKS